MLKSCRTATCRSDRRRALHRLRIFSGFAIGLMTCATLIALPPLEWASAHAQQLAAAKKRVERKGAVPKAAPKEQQERAPFTVQDEDVAVIPGIPDARIWGDSETEFARFLPQASGPWLAISGGGSDGAYGAGVLTGWSESGTRPEFAVVTGVSIGALIAPFAFLGPKYDEEVHKNFTTIAARGEQGVKLFRDILLASSSIPGFFSPVAIEVEANGKKFHELHGDGTLTAPFFVMPETMLSARSTSRPPLNQLYVIVNSKLGPEFKMPDRNIPGVLGRSIGVALTAALRAEVMLIYIGAQRHGIALRIAHVDPSFDHPSRGPFDGQYMQALYEVGVAAGKKGTAFGDTLPELSMHGSGRRQ